MTYRRLAGAAAIAVLLITSACGAKTAGSEGTTSTTRPLAPLLGAFTTVALPTGVQSLAAVDCPTALRCWAIGSTTGTAQSAASATVVTTENGGITWKVQTIPTTVAYLTGIDCIDVRTCTAVGQVGTGTGAILTTRNGGRTWALQTVPTGTTDVTAVACADEGTCMALGDITGRVTALSMSSHSSVPVANPSSSTSSTAPTPVAGWVAGGALPATVSSATGLTCTDTDHCWATVTTPVDVDHVAGGIVATTDGGTTWVAQTLPTGTGVLQGIDCTPSTTAATTTTTTPLSLAVDCTAVGTTATAIGATRSGQGEVLTSTTGGATWSPAVVTASSSDLSSVSCSAGPCVAVGTTVPAVPQAGMVVVAGSAGGDPAVWERAKTETVALPLAGVSCASLSACVVVGESQSAYLAAGS